MVTCKNCNHHFEGKFCNNCGQSADTNRLDFKFLIKNLRKNFLKYFHGGIFYSAVQLFTRPGHTIREYLDGKRVKHFEPIGLLITFATFYGVLYHTFGINMFAGISESNPNGTIDFKSVSNWMADHFAVVTLVLVPIYSIGSYFSFRKQKYNFYEHIYLNTFLGSQRLLVRIVVFPLFAIWDGMENIFILRDVLIVLDIILMVWSYTQFFNKMKRIKAILLGVLSYSIFFVLLLGIIAILISI
ncbi:MAG: DUF3667 domain-containing protein [Ignavibacteriales bacterium]|nr:DUF3667 domain-containing protein [Ignavibacteriales bacterium]